MVKSAAIYSQVQFGSIVEGMDHDAKAVANAFLRLAKSEALTNLQIQKLVYIAHGYNLAVLDEPLFRDRVYAWQFGPVIPALYDALKQYGSGEVKRRLLAETPRISEDSAEWKVIRSVWNSYSRFTGSALSSMTHKPGTPWHQIWKPGTRREIPNDVIKDYYRHFLDAGFLQRLEAGR